MSHFPLHSKKMHHSAIEAASKAIDEAAKAVDVIGTHLKDEEKAVDERVTNLISEAHSEIKQCYEGYGVSRISSSPSLTVSLTN